MHCKIVYVRRLDKFNKQYFIFSGTDCETVYTYRWLQVLVLLIHVVDTVNGWWSDCCSRRRAYLISSIYCFCGSVMISIEVVLQVNFYSNVISSGGKHWLLYMVYLDKYVYYLFICWLWWWLGCFRRGSSYIWWCHIPKKKLKSFVYFYIGEKKVLD